MNFVGFNVVTFAAFTRFCCKVWLMLVQSLSKINLDIAACKQTKLSYISDIVMWSYYLVHGYVHIFFFFLKSHIHWPINKIFGTLNTTFNGNTSLDPNCKVEINELHINFPFQVYIHESRTLGKSYGIKLRWYWERLREQLEELQLGNMMRTWTSVDHGGSLH